MARRPHGRVLVVGGTFDNIALFAVLIAGAENAGDVLLLAQRPELRRRAESLGVPTIEGWTPDLGRFDITVDASMDQRLVLQAVEATARGGTLAVSTMYPGVDLAGVRRGRLARRSIRVHPGTRQMGGVSMVRSAHLGRIQRRSGRRARRPRGKRRVHLPGHC